MNRYRRMIALSFPPGASNDGLQSAPLQDFPSIMVESIGLSALLTPQIFLTYLSDELLMGKQSRYQRILLY